MSIIKFNNVYLKDYYTIGGVKESKRLNNLDLSLKDYYFEMPTFEDAEIKMQRLVIDNLINNNKLNNIKVNYLIGGDLINQIGISNQTAQYFRIPFIGVYAACATFILSLMLGSNLINNKNAKNIICFTSSHNLTAERQFRYPVEYGNNKPETATCTSTAAVGALITNEVTNLKIVNGLIGKVINLGINDVNHMGAVMAPACADTIHEYLTSLNMTSKDFDIILTGDLGKVGINILKEYYLKVYHEKLNNIFDAGSMIYDESDDMYAGGSGPSCLPLVLFCKILRNKKYKRILLLGTGSLHNTTLVNQKKTIPAISHALSLEVL